MNSFVLSVDHLISNFTRPVVVWQVVVLLLALWAWFWVSRRLGLEGRSWPLTRRYPLLSQLRPLTNELLLFGFLILASRLLDWQTGVAGLAFFMTRFYGLCLLSRVFVVLMRQALPLPIVTQFDVRVLRPALVLFGVAALMAQVTDLNALINAPMLRFGSDSFLVSDLLLLLIGAYVLVAGTALPAWGLAWLARKLLGFSEQAYRATALLLRYLFVGIGLVLILAMVGVNTTVLAAISGGLSVGLGFGLKEVFSNFLSGLWLLLEGAVRPGDVLLLESTPGQDPEPCEVIELGMRATTLWRDRDNVELLVPNQMFFTQSMVTYSGRLDRSRRGQVLITAHYRHAPDQVIALLEETAATISRVLQDPAPKGLLLRYDASGLTYGIRYWIDDPMTGISVASELGTSLWHAMKERGIEIALPQRVLHTDARTQI
ncbi:small-conductance mechanosensitive ion channel/ MscS family [Synechococcus sp. Minos11]|uniref:mechanosensitive ion channel family protein n=1 Tax=Synechococcus sp. Minos11 TaxID=221341 RepID=UPI000EC11456|nr:mechanosensitive ion channel domain-containing protein [Synechococcus sp. Minos11]QNJ09639.1 small-conductance mechanosensitive ion channel/ MscS family [Synechococcus sp. Minos11]HCA61382.1 mechanosensitive ion channel protein MscS [Synechococcales bacterium UBA8647]|tara:strand:+ start:1128 stop:2420 length:1293 start_codon:yes stop_codon:yes gene_type:complete